MTDDPGDPGSVDAPISRPTSAIVGSSGSVTSTRGGSGSRAAAAPPGAVVIATSFGGVAALRRVLGELPADLPVPVLVILHRQALDPDPTVEVLDRQSTLPVVVAQPGRAPEPGVVTVLPVDRQVRIRPDATVATEPPTGRSATADVVLADAADCWGAGVTALILTGRLADGAEGVRAVKRGGGTVLVQDPHEAAAAGMPEAALATGCVDQSLPLHQMGSALAALTLAPGAAGMVDVTDG